MAEGRVLSALIDRGIAKSPLSYLLLESVLALLRLGAM
jgi:hypothetical protein